jgi:hypothetical protein
MTVHRFLKTVSVVLVLFLVLALLLVAALVIKSRLSNGEWQTLWSRTIGGYAVDYPAGWSFDLFAGGFHGDENQVALLWRELPFPVIEIRRKEFQHPSLQDVTNWGRQRIAEQYMRAGFEYEIMPEETVVLGNNTVTMRAYTIYAEPSPPLQKKDAYIARADDGFIITLSARGDDYREMELLFDQIVATFRSIPSD